MDSFWQRLPRPITALAPMEDVTDTVYRRLVARCGRPSVFFTEFTSVDGIFSRGRDRVIHRLKFTEEERPLMAQIWGMNPENYYRGAQLLVEMGFDGIDINMGCPVPKIVKSGACSALIENQSLAKEMYLATREGAGKLPISIKTRLGFSDWRTEEWSEFLLSLEPEALIMHGRIAKDMSSKPANWDEIAKVVACRDAAGSETVILGNGDVKSYAEILERVEQTGVDGVMVGRGVFENLYLFREDGRQQTELPLGEKMELLLNHIDLFEEAWEGVRPYRVLKKFFKNYASGFRGASEVRMRLVATESYDEVREVIHSLLDLSENCRSAGSGERAEQVAAASSVQ